MTSTHDNDNEFVVFVAIILARTLLVCGGLSKYPDSEKRTLESSDFYLVLTYCFRQKFGPIARLVIADFSFVEDAERFFKILDFRYVHVAQKVSR